MDLDEPRGRRTDSDGSKLPQPAGRQRRASLKSHVPMAMGVLLALLLLGCSLSLSAALAGGKTLRHRYVQIEIGAGECGPVTGAAGDGKTVGDGSDGLTPQLSRPR